MAKDLFFIPLGGSGGGGGFDPTQYYTRDQIDAMIADFVTASTNSLINYYLKSETYTQSEVNSLISAIETTHFEVYASLSDITNPQSNVLYLVGPIGTGSDKYEIYIYSNNQFVKIDDTSIDLSGYATTTDLQNAINTAMATLQQYAVDNFYQKSEVDAMIAQVQTLQGIQGIKGADGTNGSQGIQGVKGSDGINGAQGIQGIRGDDGKNGNDGLQGIQGIQGASGGGVETVELTELTESELGELYEIVVNSTPIDIEDYLAEHRLVAYGMPVTSWGNAMYSINTRSELVEVEEGDEGAAFYTDTRIEKVVEYPDTISTYWYCIFKRKEGGNDTYVLENGSNYYENSGGGSTRYDISTKSQAELADFYQNWQTIMASNDVYVGVYPVAAVIPEYTVQGNTALLLEYNTSFALEADATTQTPVVKGDVGAYYILPNGMGGYYGARVTMPSKDYVDAVVSGIQAIQGIQGTAGTNGVDGLQGIQGIQGASGGGSTRYDISTKSQAELADFYQNWQTLMASNDVYFGVYPVTGIVENYTLGNYTGLLVEYNINFTNYSTQTDTGTASVRNVAGSVGAYFILANGYAQNATDVSNIATVDYVNHRLGGLVYLQFVLADDSVENYRLYNANVPL